MATETRSEKETRPRRRLRFCLVALLVVLAAGVLLTDSAAILLIRSELRDRIERFEKRTGRTLTYGDLEIGVASGFTIEDLEVSGPGDDAPRVRIGRVETDLDLVDLLRGRRRPRRVTLHGLDGEISLGAEGAAAPGADDSAADALPGDWPIDVEIAGGRATVNVRGVGPVVVDGIDGVARRAEDGSLSASGTGALRVGEEDESFDFIVTGGEGGGAVVSFQRALELPVGIPDAQTVVTLRKVQRFSAEGRTLLEGVSMRGGAGFLTAERVEVRDRPGLLPSPAALAGISLERVRLRRGEQEAEASEIAVGGFAPSPDPEAPLGLPTPRRIVATRVHAQLPNADAEADVIRADLIDAPWAAVKHHRYSEALARVAVERPNLRFPMPSAVELASLPGYSTLARLRGSEPSGGNEGESEHPAAAPEPSARGLREAILRRVAVTELDISDGLLSFRGPDGRDLFSLAEVRAHFGHRAGRHPSALEGTDAQEDQDDAAQPDDLAELIEIAADARIVRGSATTGQFDVYAHLEESGRLRRAGGRVKGKDFAHFLSLFSDYVSVDPDAQVDIRFTYLPPDEREPRHRLEGEAKLSDFAFESWRLSDKTVRGLEGEASFAITHDAEAHRTVVDLPRVRFGEALFHAHLDVVKEPGKAPRIEASAGMPRQDCGAAARSIPEVLTPHLDGFRLRGEIEFEAKATVDMADPVGLQLDVTGDAESCRVVTLGPKVNIRRLKRRFVHHPVEPERGRLADIAVGRGTPEWVDSHLIPDFVKAAAVVTEDRSYYAHAGVRWDLIERALRLDLEKKRFVYGGSTITQQLVKNVFLTRDKTLSRKLEEAIIAWEMERQLDKDEILTLYLNLIEYGPDIYGVKHAARYYFAKQVWNLSPLEAAFIMGLKPYPRQGFRQWQHQGLSSWWVRRVTHVLEMMHRREGAITKTELLAAAPYQPSFRKPNDPMWSERRYIKPTSLDGSTGEGAAGTGGGDDESDEVREKAPPAPR